jgi:sigma-B regulation protein RsbU (phosphoserine phosphatase)
MATLTTRPSARGFIPARIQTACEFTQVLMKLQRATHLIASTLELECLLDRVVNDIASSIGSVEVSVWLRDNDTDEMVLQGVRGCTKFSKGSRRIGRQGMVGYVAATGKMRYAADVRKDPYYIPCEPDTLSSVAIPFKVSGRVTGVLCVDYKELNAFSDDQIKVLQAVAGHIAIAVENARVFHLERQHRERLQQESAEARAIQEALFLKAVPLIPGFAIETAWHPAGSVAGDWFDFMDLGSDRYGIALADVSGKGMPAALLMSATRALLRTIAPLDPSPSRTLERLNHALIEDFPAGKFVTMIYGVLDARSREFRVASAGHLPPLVVNDQASYLELETGLPLGLAQSSYPECAVTISAGTRVLLYTDGITEASDKAGEEYGPARLMQHFVSPDACINGLVAEVQRYSVGSAHTDDATAVLLRSR